MRTSVLCNMVLLVLAAMVDARYRSSTSPPGPSTNPETTPQMETATPRLRSAESAGGQGADGLQRAWSPPCEQEARQQVEVKLQAHDDAMRALLEKLTQQMEENMEKTLGVLVQTLSSATKDGDAYAEIRFLINKLDERLMNLEANVQRMLPSSEPSTTLTFAPTSLPSSPTPSLSSSALTSFTTSSPNPRPSSASTSAPTPSRLEEALLLAASGRSAEPVRCLLDAGADVNYRGARGRSPLMEALYREGPCDQGVVSLLLQRGALVNATDEIGQTPLHYAASNTGARCVALLVGAGADVEAKTTRGKTPLLLAAKNSKEANVRALLGAGADANARDNYGKVPLHWAAYKSNKASVRALLGGGADPNAREGDGDTPLHWAAVYKNEAIVRALLAAGARKDLRPWSGHWKDQTPFDVLPLDASDAIRNLLRP